MEYSKLGKSTRPVTVWLLTGVAMIIIQILLGGITRLTGSGLSITEWKPLLGAIPPLNDEDWQTDFGKYQQIAQYKHLNTHFDLSDFKFIYFWEWLHRLWGRLLGIVFIIPFLLFVIQGRFKKDMIWPLAILFVLGSLQGLVGWIMVKSGLNNEDLYVSHFRLAIHFIAAIGLLVYTFWLALKFLVPEKAFAPNKPLRNFALCIIALMVLQLVYGAFMAGLKAGPFAPTWPDINGELIPGNMTTLHGAELSGFSALVNHPIAIHFVHRTLAYLLVILIILWTFKASSVKQSSLFNRLKFLPLVLVFLQVLLGITSVFTSYKATAQGWGIFEWNAQLHQLAALVLLLCLVMVVFVLSRRERI